jgi:hypothetical protein
MYSRIRSVSGGRQNKLFKRPVLAFSRPDPMLESMPLCDRWSFAVTVDGDGR